MLIEKDELNIYEVESLHRSILDAFAKDDRTIDLKNVNRIDMSIIQLFISAQKTAQKDSKQFQLKNVNDEVAQIIHSAACDFLLEVTS